VFGPLFRPLFRPVRAAAAAGRRPNLPKPLLPLSYLPPASDLVWRAQRALDV